MPGHPIGNLFTRLPHDPDRETCESLLERPGLRIERIVSRGHASPPGHWYDQPHGEWVALLQGSARLEFDDGREPVDLEPGTFVDLPAGCRHRVAWTDSGGPTLWLAVHYDGSSES